MQSYLPPITAEHHTCVGLGLTLLNKLADLDYRFPGLASRLYIVSCEEAVDDISGYVNDNPDPKTVEKEHVMVALKLEIAGRLGLLLLDPGYHVARVVTVMEDELYPHTGWFMQSKEEHCKKDYNYVFSAGCNYVIWRVKERRRDSPESVSHSVVFVSHPFLAPVDVTERRNLVYNFRSLLSRNTKGHLTAGIYFPIQNSGMETFTIFYESNGIKKRDKMSFCDFQTMNNILGEKQRETIEECNTVLGLQAGQLYSVLHKVATMFLDSDFINQLLLINKDINYMAENN